MTENYYGKWIFTRWYFWAIIVALLLMDIQNIYSVGYFFGYLVGSFVVSLAISSLFYLFRKKK